MMRKIVLVLLVLAMAQPLFACGRKGGLENPPGTTYPREYPAR